ncbi:MAG: hypothetical protein V4613_14930 [Bacteroidota bacterium]
MQKATPVKCSFFYVGLRLQNFLLKPSLHHIVFLFLGLCYLTFPNNNAAIDSWYYAACVKHGEELINSHHLLYNIIGKGWYSVLLMFNPACHALQALNSMNAIAGTACLFICFATLKQLGTEKNSAFLLTLIAGASYGFMRFTTDAETYILPLFLSLASTYYLAKGLTLRNSLISGLLACCAILVHELHIWWALAILVFLCRQKPFKWQLVLCYSLPFLLTPIAYLIAYQSLHHPSYTFYQFILGEYGKSNASLSLSLAGALLTIVNAIRSFVQIHGQFLHLFKHYGLYLVLPVVIAIAFALKGFIALKRIGIGIRSNSALSFSGLFLMAFLLHLMFAFLSSGNAEFMVMLPFLFILYAGSRYTQINLIALKLFFCALFIWNLTLGILPHSLLIIEKADTQTRFEKQHPSAVFLWANKPLVENVMTYQMGFSYHGTYIKPQLDLTHTIDSFLIAGKRVYTDMNNNRTRFSREALLRNWDATEIVNTYQLIPLDSFNTIYGKNYVLEIVKKPN